MTPILTLQALNDTLKLLSCQYNFILYFIVSFCDIDISECVVMFLVKKKIDLWGRQRQRDSTGKEVKGRNTGPPGLIKAQRKDKNTKPQ